MQTKISPFTALKFGSFRYFWFGSIVSEAGNQMQTVAIAWQVYELTHSPISLGLIGLSGFIPLLFFSLLGGLFADRVNRRKLLILTQALQGFSALGLFLLTYLGHISPPWIYAVLVFNGIVGSFNQPARQSMMPSLVPNKFFMNAVSLNTMQFQAAQVLGPAAAGLIIANFNVGMVYFINAVSFLFIIASLLLIRIPLRDKKQAASLNWHSIREGIKFVKGTQILYSTMLLDFFATFFGTANILMPVFAKDVLKVGAQGLGALYAAPAVGGVLAGLVLSSVHSIKRQGEVILIAVFVYGLAIVGFGLSGSFYLSLVFLALMGGADMIGAIIRNTIRQMITPDRLRGRMASIMRLFFQGGPLLGDIEAGFLAFFLGGPVTVLIGGMGTMLATSLVAKLLPDLRRYHPLDPSDSAQGQPRM